MDGELQEELKLLRVKQGQSGKQVNPLFFGKCVESSAFDVSSRLRSLVGSSEFREQYFLDSIIAGVKLFSFRIA